MISGYDKKLLKECGQEYLLDIVLESNYLKENLTFKEHVLLCNQVKNLTYEEVISLTITESVRDFEGKFGKFLKYSLAAIAGFYTGGLGGPPITMFILYLYRKLTDSCVASCIRKTPLSSQKKICKLSCQLNAAKKMEHDIRAEITKCGQFKYADKCEKKLQGEYIKWAKRVQLLTVRLNQARVGIEEKQRKAKQKELASKARTLAAGFQLPKDEILKLITENQSLRERLPFKKHIELYNIVKNISEQDEPKMVKINPKKEKIIRTGLYLGLWAVPVPFFNDVVNYYVKKYDVVCASKCAKNEKVPRNVCYNQCAYLSAKYAVKTLNDQLSKCGKAKEPIKCKKSIYKMLEDWKQREVERKIRFETSMKVEIKKAQQRNLKSNQ